LRRLRYLGLCGLLVVALLLAALPVFAAEEGPESSPLTPLFQWINFAIVAGFLGWLLVKKAPGFFGSRAAQIASAIEEGTRLKKQAEAKRDEARRRLANLATELEELRAASRRDAAAENGRIQAATREEAAKIDHAAQMEVEAAARSARLELRALGAKLAVERAEVLLRAELSPAAEDGIFTAFLGELTAPGGQAGRVN
jgi:F-type H+-transporting ATPase subunit b